MDDRLNRVETAITRHDEQIASLFSKMNDVNAHLTNIQNTLNQIKYIAIGMIAYFILQEFGFFAAFKAVKGIV
jgi:hypothetical protein